MLAVQKVGGRGKPVRIRRGPATVTGRAPLRTRAAQPLGPSGVREGAERERPGSQETCPDRQAHTPSWKGVAPLRTTLGLALAAVTLMAAAPAGAATVNVQIEGAGRQSGPVAVVTPADFKKDGTHTCNGTSAAGAI